MNRELALLNILLCAGFTDNLLRQCSRFSQCDHPADDIAAEDVQNHIQVKVGPFYWTEELSNVPRPDLVRGRSQKLRFLIHRVAQLVPAFLDLFIGVEYAVHGADGTTV